MKQAIIVIHGIGEQRPMSTLRDFAEAILPIPDKVNIPKYWSKPDRMSELFELRKLTAPQTREQPPTDLYEYYWAYQAQGTKIKHVLSWAKTLFLRWPWNVPAHLQFLWWVTWGLLASGTLIYFAPTVRVVGRWSANAIIGALITLLFATVQGFIINYLGDAARYLDARPDNITFRREVRAAGIQLLRRLHGCGELQPHRGCGTQLGQRHRVRHSYPRLGRILFQA